MSLMFAKQFSEAGQATATTGKRGGRGRGGGSGLMSKGKRGARRDQEDAGEASGLFNMDASSAYRTHMLFPGRKDEDGAEPRRSSGSPSFMKAMMSWGKRPSDAKAGQNAQELARYRGTPTRASESELDSLDHYFRKTVSFDEDSSSPTLLPDPTNTSYHQPLNQNEYASFVGGRTCFTNNLINSASRTSSPTHFISIIFNIKYAFFDEILQYHIKYQNCRKYSKCVGDVKYLI